MLYQSYFKKFDYTVRAALNVELYSEVKMPAQPLDIVQPAENGSRVSCAKTPFSEVVWRPRRDVATSTLHESWSVVTTGEKRTRQEQKKRTLKQPVPLDFGHM